MQFVLQYVLVMMSAARIQTVGWLIRKRAAFVEIFTTRLDSPLTMPSATVSNELHQHEMYYKCTRYKSSNTKNKCRDVFLFLGQ